MVIYLYHHGTDHNLTSKNNSNLRRCLSTWWPTRRLWTHRRLQLTQLHPWPIFWVLPTWKTIALALSSWSYGLGSTKSNVGKLLECSNLRKIRSLPQDHLLNLHGFESFVDWWICKLGKPQKAKKKGWCAYFPNSPNSNLFVKVIDKSMENDTMKLPITALRFLSWDLQRCQQLASLCIFVCESRSSNGFHWDIQSCDYKGLQLKKPLSIM